MHWLVVIVKLNIHNKGYNMSGFLTNSGLAKLAVATPLTPMTVKYMAFDSGTGTASPSMSALFNEVYRTEIPNPVKDPSEPKNLVFSGFVPTTVGGWTVYGVGLFDSLNVLVAYLQLAEPILKSSPDSALKMSWQQDFIITLANSGETDLIITDSIEFRHDAITHRDLPESHPISAITGLQDALDNQIVHNNLLGRNSADAHPISAIFGLQDNLDNKDASIGLDRKYKKITSNYTVANDDGGLIEVDASSGDIVITMAKSTAHIAKEISFIRTDSSVNTVTLDPTSGDNFYIEGANYSLAPFNKYELFTATAGEDYWTGGRSNQTILTTTSGTLKIVDKGIDIGQPVLMADIADMFVGMVSPFAMNSAPSGWLACSGQSVSRITYAKLFAKIGTTFGTGDGSTTFKLPDMRGEFIRGFDGGRGVDTGRDFGSNQADEFSSHNHNIKMGGDANAVVPTNTNNAVTTSVDGGGIYGSIQISSVGGTETRPRNIAMLYCIKY